LWTAGLDVFPRPASSLPETHVVCEDRLAGPCVFRDSKAGSWVAGSRWADGCDGDDDGVVSRAQPDRDGLATAIDAALDALRPST
jgi:hypothetical protein